MLVHTCDRDHPDLVDAGRARRSPGSSSRSAVTVKGRPLSCWRPESGKLPQHGRFGRVSVVSGPQRPGLTAILPDRHGCLGSAAWEAAACLRTRAGNVRKNRTSLVSCSPAWFADLVCIYRLRGFRTVLWQGGIRRETIYLPGPWSNVHSEGSRQACSGTERRPAKVGERPGMFSRGLSNWRWRARECVAWSS